MDVRFVLGREGRDSPDVCLRKYLRSQYRLSDYNGKDRCIFLNYLSIGVALHLGLELEHLQGIGGGIVFNIDDSLFQ